MKKNKNVNRDVQWRNVEYREIRLRETVINDVTQIYPQFPPFPP